MNFSKYHGLGNDFIILYCRGKDTDVFIALAEKMCHRNFGIGADGLLLLANSDNADFAMRIINSDGSEPEMCGNGIRCMARYINDFSLSEKKELTIETLAGLIKTKIYPNQDKYLVAVDMGVPILEADKIPVKIATNNIVSFPYHLDTDDFLLTAVSMGNPHCVVFINNPDIPFAEWGAKLEKAEIFPQKTNVEFVTVIDKNNINMRVWERGVGETMACGTGACASVVASFLNGYTDRHVKVRLAGGTLEINWNTDDNRVIMTGPAVHVFDGKSF